MRRLDSLLLPGPGFVLLRSTVPPVLELFGFEIVSGPAGEGEFGVVRRASFHGTDVAVKVLKVSHGIALGDFRTEIAILRQVHHPNAVSPPAQRISSASPRRLVLACLPYA